MTRNNVRHVAQAFSLACRYTILMLGVCLLVSGCAHFITSPGSEAALRDIVSKEWQAKIDKEWGTVYELTSSKFRKSIKRDQFLRGCRLDVKSFTIANLEISPDKKQATVTVRFDIQQMGRLFKGMQLKETWIWEDCEWRLDLPTKPISPFKR
ncbi:MAG: hypothetical protein IMF11_00790 [Proteobacteria bacterium]|nr:hypothetical protein [Pseudomonadota bacterium]